jgi:hypothetical protein
MRSKPALDPEKELIRKLLYEAFARPPKDKILTREQRVELRGDIGAVGFERLQFWLPQVLEELLDSYDSKPAGSSDAISVVRCLTACTEDADFEFIRKRWGEEAVKKAMDDQTYLRNEAEKNFSQFTSEQALAIYKWLEFARKWEDLSIYTDEVDVAMRYWLNRTRSTV